MESYGKHKGAGGREPDFGAIFMTNSATLRECFERRLFGLPSPYIQFVKQIKAGMILFLFEYDKRELHGVYKSRCDGAINIVPDAFSSSGRQFPAQVEFIPIWDCEPLKESKFRDAIRENYFSPKKFHFGLSEKQVHELLDLFSKRRLPGRQLIRTKYVKPEQDAVGKVGRSVGGPMHVEIVKNEQDALASTLMHNYQGDSFHYTGVDDEEHSIGMQLRPTISGCLSGKFPGEVRVHGDDGLRVSDRLMSEHNTKPGQRMVFFDDVPGLHNSNVGSSFLSNKSMLDPDSLVQNQLMATSAMPHPIQAPISDNFCVAQGDLNSKSMLLYDPDVPGFNIRQPSSARIRINDSSKLILESVSPSNNYRRNIMHSLDDQPSHIYTELKDINQSQGCSYGLVNHVSFESNTTSMAFCGVQNSERLTTKLVEPVEFESLERFPFKSSSILLPHSYIGNGGWGAEPCSSLYNHHNSHLSDDICSAALHENLGHDEMTLQKNSETCSAVPWENEIHSQIQYGHPSFHEHDPNFENHGNSGSSYSGYKKKNSVFSRLSFVNVSDKEYGSNCGQVKYNVSTLNSVDEVMNMVRQSYNQWRMKRKLNPWVKINKAESLRDRKIRSSGSTKAPSGKSLDDTSMDIMTTEGDGETNQIDEDIRSVDFKCRSQVQKINQAEIRGSDESVRSETNQIDEDIRFVDFKRRSHVRKINHAEIRGSDENVRSEELGTVQQKKRKLIRPNFSKSTAPDDKKDINLGSSQNLQVSLSIGSLETKEDTKGCEAVIQTEENLNIDGRELTLGCQTHLKDGSDHARGCVNPEGEGKPREGWSIPNVGLNDGSQCPERLHNQKAFSSAFCEAKAFHNKEGLCIKDDIKPIFSDTELQHSIGQVHNEEKVEGAGGCINIGEGTIKDGRQLFSTEVKDVPGSAQNFANKYTSHLTCEKSIRNIEKGSSMNNESQDASGVAENSEPCEDSFEKEKGVSSHD